MVSSDPSVDWFTRSGATSLKGVAVVIPGLNLNPDRMAAVISALNMAGIDAARLSLQGHGLNFQRQHGMNASEARLESFKCVSYPLWSQETLGAYEQARQSARQNQVPLFLIAFSYGGLMGLDLLASREDVRFHRAVLFAPALSLRGWDYAIRLFSPFPRMVIPALAPAAYLANPGTPIAGYNVLFETLDHFESRIGLQLNIPTLVIMDPGDELVSYDGLKRLAAEHRLDRWQFYPVRNHRSLLKGMLRHIVIDEASLGQDAWSKVKTALVTHLLADHVSQDPV
ncbi:MAG: serine aminopeptidase domain-containing protein [Hyphomicrobiales bacterium]